MTRFFNRSILNSSLRHHALLVGMLYLAHFGHRVCQLDNCRMRIPPRQDHMHHIRLLFQTFHHFGRIEHPIANRVIYLIQYDEVPLTRLNCLLRVRPSLFDHAHVFRIRLLSAYLHEAAAHLLHDKFVAERMDRVEFAVMPRSFQKLQHEPAHPLPDCPQRRAHRSRGLSFARPGVHDDESAANVVHSTRILDCNRWPCLARYRRTAITARPNRVGLQAKWLQCAPDLEKRCSQSQACEMPHSCAHLNGRLYSACISENAMRHLLNWVLSALGVWVVARLIPGFHVSGPLAALIAALAIGFINATLGAFLKIITFPLTLLTLGIFWLVINALMLELASKIVRGFQVDSFAAASLAAIVLSLVNMFFRWLLGTSRRRS